MFILNKYVSKCCSPEWAFPISKTEKSIMTPYIILVKLLTSNTMSVFSKKDILLLHCSVTWWCKIRHKQSSSSTNSSPLWHIMHQWWVLCQNWDLSLHWQWINKDVTLTKALKPHMRKQVTSYSLCLCLIYLMDTIRKNVFCF